MVITQPSHSNSGPFANRTTFDHLNTRLIQYSDGYCIFFVYVKLIFIKTQKSGSTFQDGFSFCLRIQLKIWNSNCFLKSTNEYQIGIVFLGKTIFNGCKQFYKLLHIHAIVPLNMKAFH